eukprot:CAMPEP_0174711004 /NCGR_PEP_ID=MMETSP1094-20130205/12454_1 /TAXON_ID=156173 /ORGANISM="Chrysochromulina brevifilum, Strain UTEX LB 985" /LENGTH=95 /DNA_ID=CAMNT_0015909881 /DNA_START=374 /DNA_END=658 /DNA_ORIENTATION=-
MAARPLVAALDRRADRRSRACASQTLGDERLRFAAGRAHAAQDGRLRSVERAPGDIAERLGFLLVSLTGGASSADALHLPRISLLLRSLAILALL